MPIEKYNFTDGAYLALLILKNAGIHCEWRNQFDDYASGTSTMESKPLTPEEGKRYIDTLQNDTKVQKILGWFRDDGSQFDHIFSLRTSNVSSKVFLQINLLRLDEYADRNVYFSKDEKEALQSSHASSGLRKLI